MTYFVLLLLSEYIGYICKPVLLYSFDKACDRTVYDESGRGNNGQLIGGAKVSGGKQHIGHKVQSTKTSR